MDKGKEICTKKKKKNQSACKRNFLFCSNVFQSSLLQSAKNLSVGSSIMDHSHKYSLSFSVKCDRLESNITSDWLYHMV